MNRTVQLVLLSLAVDLLILTGVATFASGSSIGPAPQTSSNSACPSASFVQGTEGEYGALVFLQQPGPSSGTTCELTQGGTLVGSALIVLLYTPEPVPNNSVPIAVEEFVWATELVNETGPNNTVLHVPTQVKSDVVFSNTSIGANAGDSQEFELTVPEVQSPEQISIGILGIRDTYAIVTPGAGVSIPSDYPQLLEHDLGFGIAVGIFFVIGIGIATAIRMRARHVDRLWPFGAAGLVSAFGFVGWFYSDYPYSAVPIGSTPEALVAAPVVLVGIYFWLAMFPTEARLRTVRFPVADAVDGSGLYDVKQWRVYRGPEGLEYIGTGGGGVLARLLGFRTKFDDRILTDTPAFRRNASFRSVRGDVEGTYFAWAEGPKNPKILDVAKPRLFVLPWRERTRAAIAEYHAGALRGRVPPPQKVGLFVYVSPSWAFLAAVGSQGSVLVEGWIAGTVQASQIGIGFEQLIVANTQLRIRLRSEAIDWGQKIAYCQELARSMPGSPLAMRALEDLTASFEAQIMDVNGWFENLQRLVEEEKETGTRARPASVAERVRSEAVQQFPPTDARRRALPPGKEKGR